MPRLIAFVVAALTVSANATAVPTCGPWIPQANGSDWRQCVDDQNRQYCEIREGSEIRRMRCP